MDFNFFDPDDRGTLTLRGNQAQRPVKVRAPGGIWRAVSDSIRRIPCGVHFTRLPSESHRRFVHVAPSLERWR